jgi:hypothetical protein
MNTYLLTIGLIMGIGLLGITVDRIYRSFAMRHPQLGPFRDSDKGCGCCSAASCDNGGCSNGSCETSHCDSKPS